MPSVVFVLLRLLPMLYPLAFLFAWWLQLDVFSMGLHPGAYRSPWMIPQMLLVSLIAGGISAARVFGEDDHYVVETLIWNLGRVAHGFIVAIGLIVAAFVSMDPGMMWAALGFALSSPYWIRRALGEEIEMPF